ncbi:MAG: hypothetical protein IPJ81_18335 [Chitinophagaceae bacterium]|nr:hypothetical protein [Chitinophagaceae bacterium]
MKKITIGLIILFTIIIISCKKSKTGCYECNTTQTGVDTVICDKTKAEIDALNPNTLNSCIKTD